MLHGSLFFGINKSLEVDTQKTMKNNKLFLTKKVYFSKKDWKWIFRKVNKQRNIILISFHFTTGANSSGGCVWYRNVNFITILSVVVITLHLQFFDLYFEHDQYDRMPSPFVRKNVLPSTTNFGFPRWPATNKNFSSVTLRL